MKRRLLIAAVFLLAGAVVNVAVAWVLAIRVTPMSPSQIVPTYQGVYEGVDDSQWWWCQVLVRPGYEQVVWERPHVSKVPTAYSGDVVVETNDVVQLDLLGSWSGRRSVDWLPRGFAATQEKPPGRVDQDAVPSWAGDPQSIESGGRVRSAFGWPSVAMWHERLLTVKSGQQIVTAGGLRLADGLQHLGQGRILPYRIIASGFAVNALFYAVVLWLLICGPFALRRFVRIRRGLCPACAYPMGEPDVCSECGKALAGRAKVTT